ncbi:MAG: GNAT family N-acetyltransferase [Steroidobacteraceae bacterium]
MASSITLQTRRPRRPWLARLIERMRHGLLEQEILDRLARSGVICYPYFVSVEPAVLSRAAPGGDGYQLRTLTQADAAEISRITLLKTSATTTAAMAARMEHAVCIGAFADRELVAYTWIGFDGLPTPGSGRQWLFRFRPDEACLFDLYVVPEHRGQRIAMLLRDYTTRVLEQRKCRTAYSVSLAFNRATRRFKGRIGVREAELRLYLHLRWGRLPGVDVRLRRFGLTIAAPRAKRVSRRR